MQFRVAAKPERKLDVPKPHNKTARKVELPDGEHWVEIAGGFSHEERRFSAWWWTEADRIAKIEDPAKREAEENDLNAYMASFFGTHITKHNLTYAGTDDPLPADGFDLFWELSIDDALGIMRRITQPRSFFEDPKAAPSSATG